MSKSPNILLPALGVTGVVLGGAYGTMTRGYKADEAEIAASSGSSGASAIG